MKEKLALVAKARDMGSKVRDMGYKTAAALTCALPVAVFAQTTDPGIEAIEAIGTKVSTFGAALVLLSTIGVGFAVAVKYVKKSRGAS